MGWKCIFIGNIFEENDGCYFILHARGRQQKCFQACNILQYLSERKVNWLQIYTWAYLECFGSEFELTK